MEGKKRIRKCRGCGKWYDAAQRDPRSRSCPECRAKREAKGPVPPSHQRDYARDYQRKYWARNREKKSESQRAYYLRTIEARREYGRVSYRENHPKTVRAVKWSEEHGRTMEFYGNRACYYWTPSMDAHLRRLYPWRSDEDCAVEIGVSRSSARRRALALGLRKDPRYKSAIARKRGLIGGAVSAARKIAKKDARDNDNY